MRQWLAAIALVALVSVLLSRANAQFDDAEFSGCGGFVGLSSALSKYGGCYFAPRLEEVGH